MEKDENKIRLLLINPYTKGLLHTHKINYFNCQETIKNFMTNPFSVTTAFNIV